MHNAKKKKKENLENIYSPIFQAQQDLSLQKHDCPASILSATFVIWKGEERKRSNIRWTRKKQSLLVFQAAEEIPGKQKFFFFLSFLFSFLEVFQKPLSDGNLWREISVPPTIPSIFFVGHIVQKINFTSTGNAFKMLWKTVPTTRFRFFTTRPSLSSFANFPCLSFDFILVVGFCFPVENLFSQAKRERKWGRGRERNASKTQTGIFNTFLFRMINYFLTHFTIFFLLSLDGF